MGESFIVRRGGSSNIASVPEFTYSDEQGYIFVQEDSKNWHIEILSSGTLTFQKVKPDLEVFLCGGGASGGQGKDVSYSSGYTHYQGGAGGNGGKILTSSITGVTSKYPYEIVIGGSDGETSAFNLITSSGTSSAGGEAGTGYEDTISGGDGEDGVCAFNEPDFFVSAFNTTGYKFGAGGGGGGGYMQEHFEYGRTIHGFGGKGGANGGGDGGGNTDNLGNHTPPTKEATAGVANSGGGGGGARIVYNDGGAGGSGIVIIRNVRGNK